MPIPPPPGARGARARGAAARAASRIVRPADRPNGTYAPLYSHGDEGREIAVLPVPKSPSDLAKWGLGSRISADNFDSGQTAATGVMGMNRGVDMVRGAPRAEGVLEQR